MFVSFVFTLISEPRATVCSGTLMERDSSCLENGCSFCLGGADWAVLMTAAVPPISSNANVLIALPPYCTPLRLGFTRKVNSRTLEKHKDAPPVYDGVGSVKGHEECASRKRLVFSSPERN